MMELTLASQYVGKFHLRVRSQDGKLLRVKWVIRENRCDYPGVDKERISHAIILSSPTLYRPSISPSDSTL